jgi:two-component sensor histidine kinase
MTVNELCTNATKFGALANQAGRVNIDWTVDLITQRLSLKWTESGGPQVQQPSRRSFGTRMIESLGQQLNGNVRLNYPSSGFEYSLDVPIESLIK